MGSETKGPSILFNLFIDMRTTVSLSISCRKNVFLMENFNKNTFFLYETDKLTVVLMSIKWLNKKRWPLVYTLKFLSLKNCFFFSLFRVIFFLYLKKKGIIQLFCADAIVLWKNRPQTLLIIGPNLLFHSPAQPRIDFLKYKHVPRRICFLICGSKVLTFISTASSAQWGQIFSGGAFSFLGSCMFPRSQKIFSLFSIHLKTTKFFPNFFPN